MDTGNDHRRAYAGTLPGAPERRADTELEPLRLEPGAQLRQYELIRELGRGGMGVVFAARDMRLGRRVAIKFLQHAGEGVAERFLIEARATAQCTHENIVIIHEVDEHDGTPYMVLEFLEGQTLEELIESSAPLPPSRVIDLALPIARALTRAHELGIIHRDLKPGNVFVTRAGQVKVLDFGIAKALGTSEVAMDAQLSGSDLQLTRDHGLVGTPAYMSPEHFGVGTVDHRADLWSLGIILFEMLAGTHPVEPFGLQELINNAASDEPMRSLGGVARDVPDELARLVDHCLRKSSAERIGDAATLVGKLEALLPARTGRRLAADECPYPGLIAFQEADADRFFGRSREIDRVVARLRDQPLVAIVGPSGAGKSSFVRAGIGPALKASGERWELFTCRPGRQPVAELATAALQLVGQDPATARPEHGMLQARLRSEPGYFGTLLRRRARHVETRILVFVDQFEELYTLGASLEDRRVFTAALAGVADDSASPLRIILSLRSDFLDRLAEDPGFLDEVSRGLSLLATPDRDGLRDAVVEPVEMAGYRFESSAMIGEMLDALAGTPGALPLLQFAGAKLWEARDRERRLLTNASYDALGGISGALATHADEVLTAMSGTARRLAKQVLRRLVTPERTRAIIELEDLAQLAPDRAEVTRVVDRLVAARLLVVHTRDERGSGGVELVHESLIDRWPTLRRWLDEDEGDAAFIAQIAAAAKQWEARGRPAGLLWRGEMLEEARRWDAHGSRQLAGRDRAFVDAMLALARRGRIVRRAGLIAAFTALALVAGGASVAYVRVKGAEREAEQKRIEAEKSKANAEQALRDKIGADERSREAQTRRAAAERDAQAKGDQVKRSREELEEQNLKLEAALGDARAAKDQAERATVRAETAAAAARKATQQKEQALEIERARVRALEEEKRKLATKLK